MTRRLSYKAPSRLTVNVSTPERQDDTDRGSLWTQWEVDWLLRNYGCFTARDCAAMLRRSEVSVRIKIHRVRHGMNLGHVSPKHQAKAA